MLRAAFTRQLAARLLSGTCINLIGPHGQGRRRTLADLRTLLPATLAVCHIDLRLQPDALAARLAQPPAPDAPLLLIVHNIHLLRSSSLLSGLNKLGNTPYISLLCVSEKLSDQPELAAEPLHLPPLTRQQLVDEALRRGMMPDQETVDQLLSDPAPCSALARLLSATG